MIESSRYVLKTRSTSCNCLITACHASPPWDDEACRHAAVNVPGAEVLAGDVGKVLASGAAPAVDLVVLDPPRTGAKRTVVEQVVARRPRAVAYVACDPAALARDVAIFAEHGYALRELRAFDAFPMTHHVECVALLEETRTPSPSPHAETR